MGVCAAGRPLPVSPPVSPPVCHRPPPRPAAANQVPCSRPPSLCSSFITSHAHRNTPTFSLLFHRRTAMRTRAWRRAIDAQSRSRLDRIQLDAPASAAPSPASAAIPPPSSSPLHPPFVLFPMRCQPPPQSTLSPPVPPLCTPLVSPLSHPPPIFPLVLSAPRGPR